MIALAVTNSGHIVSGDVNDVTRESTMLPGLHVLGFSLNLPRLPLFTETRTADEMAVRAWWWWWWWWVASPTSEVISLPPPFWRLVYGRWNWRTEERVEEEAARMFYN